MTAVPDPLFRDQLAEVLSRHYPLNGLQGVVCGGCNWSGRDREYREHLADALAAEVEARVQAAANQRAAEVGRCGDEAPSLVGGSAEWCRLPAGHLGWHRGDNGSEWTHGAAALASPAPAPHAGGIVANGHQWPCPGFYDTDDQPACACTGEAPAPHAEEGRR